MASVEHSLSQTNMMAGGVVKEIKDLVRLRLIVGSTFILIALIGLLGADWDIQWHAVVGRDRTFTPPHDMILVGIGLSGIVALINILIETSWARQYPNLRIYSTDFLGILHSSLGSYLIGFGAVCSGVAFPLDTYWHSLYGIDVSLWAPFHVMIYMGSVLGTFGVIYHLLSAVHLSEMQDDRRATMFGYAGVMASLGIQLSKFSTFLYPALKEYHLGILTLSLFPFLMALVAVFVCVLTVRLVPWTGAASMVVVAFLLVFLLVNVFVPPMMTWLVQAEHETYLSRASRIGSTIIPLLGQTPMLLLLALGLDGVVWLGRRGKWALAIVKKWWLVVALVSMFLVTGFILVQSGMSEQAARGGGLRRSLIGIALSLLLTIPGSLLGNWLALTISKTVQALRR